MTSFGFVFDSLIIYYRMNETQPMRDYLEHKYGEESKHTLESALIAVNQLQHRLGTMETEAKLMRAAINDIGQHLCNTNGLKLRWEGIKGLDGDA